MLYYKIINVCNVRKIIWFPRIITFALVLHAVQSNTPLHLFNVQHLLSIISCCWCRPLPAVSPGSSQPSCFLPSPQRKKGRSESGGTWLRQHWWERDSNGAQRQRAGGERRFSFSNLIWGGSRARQDKRRKERCPSPTTGKGRLEQSPVSGIQASDPSQSHR